MKNNFPILQVNITEYINLRAAQILYLQASGTPYEISKAQIKS